MYRIVIILFFVSQSFGKSLSLYDSLFVGSTICDTALSYLNSSRKDLFFPVRTTDYSLVFPVINSFFKQQPLQVKSAEEFALVCREFPNLDFNLVSQQFLFSLAPKGYINDLSDFIETVKLAKSTKDSAWTNCSDSDKSLILEYFKKGQSSRVLTKNTTESYSFANDELGNLFASRVQERADWELTHKFYKETMSKLRPAYFVKSGIILYSALQQLQQIYQTDPTQFRTGITETDFGRIAIGSGKDDNYSGNYFLILEPSGNDSYNLNCDSLEFQFVIDFAGNDNYRAEKNGPCAAFNGVNILFDLNGSDSYMGKDNSNSAATLGFSALIDFSGNDLYSSADFGQAAAVLGFACLWDKSGSDRYLASSQAQGYAGTYGISILCDESGNDSYLAVSQQVDELRYADHFNSMSQGFSIGERDHSGGGIAILSDKSGNDIYQSDIFGQGTGYWLSFGALLDYSGNDSYLSYQYTQGSGVHFAFGILLDYSGNDLYRAKGVSMGSGHDYAGGVLIDVQGDDSYLAESLSLGSGNANGLSMFIDLSGADLYDTKDKSCLGYSDWRRDCGYLGFFWDNGGLDRYSFPKAGNQKIWYNETWGVGVDR